MEPTILVKQGVVFRKLNQYWFEFSAALYAIAKKYQRAYTITSANDGTHRDDSFHYLDTAWDIRLKDKPRDHWEVLRLELKTNLPPYFDFVIEGVDGDHPHLHVEADLGKVATWLLQHADIVADARDHAEGS